MSKMKDLLHHLPTEARATGIKTTYYCTRRKKNFALIGYSLYGKQAEMEVPYEPHVPSSP